VRRGRGQKNQLQSSKEREREKNCQKICRQRREEEKRKGKNLNFVPFVVGALLLCVFVETPTGGWFSVDVVCVSRSPTTSQRRRRHPTLVSREKRERRESDDNEREQRESRNRRVKRCLLPDICHNMLLLACDSIAW
jgi:hypothetical protein